jgi:hypothetical protein
MKPHIHAENSAKKFGGKSNDYLKIHQWFDASKEQWPDNRHRALRHHTFGIFDAERVFGVVIVNSDRNNISVRDIGEQHVLEDLGFIPTVADYFQYLEYKDWMHHGNEKPEKINEKNIKHPLNSVVSFDDDNAIQNFTQRLID